MLLDRRSRLLLRTPGPATRSYSIPMSCSAFSTRQQGWPLIFTHWLEQRCSFTAIGVLLARDDGPTIRRVRATYEIRPPAWGETLAILQSVSLPDGPERVRARVVDVDGERVTVEFPALDGETSAEQLLAACVAGEWADRGDVESCRLVEVEWPEGMPGPAFPAQTGRLGRRDRQAGARADPGRGGRGCRGARGRRRRPRQGRRAAAVVAGAGSARSTPRSRSTSSTRRTSPAVDVDAIVEAGARALMVNAFLAGLGSIARLREYGLPIFVHRVGSAFLRRGGAVSVSARRARRADAAARRRLRPGRIVLAAHLRHRRRGAGADRGGAPGDRRDRRRRRRRERARAARAARARATA